MRHHFIYPDFYKILCFSTEPGGGYELSDSLFISVEFDAQTWKCLLF